MIVRGDAAHAVVRGRWQARLDSSLGSAQTGTANTDDHIKRMVDEIVCGCRTHIVPRRTTAAQLRAARVLLGIDQRRLAELWGLSVPTIQRMEASEAMVRGNVDSLVKLITALDAAGIELIDEGAVSSAEGRGVRLKINSGSAKIYLNNRIENKASSGTKART